MKYITSSQFVSAIIATIISLGILNSCKKIGTAHETISTDLSKPGVVKSVSVLNFEGGAHIIYEIPSSPNLLYVQADYNINEKKSRQTKSSYFSDTITVSGFSESKEYEVILHVVTRANVMSDPVSVVVHPLTPPFRSVFPSTHMQPDFGGVKVTAQNPNRHPLGFVFIAMDPTTNNYEIEDQFFTATADIDFSARGYDTITRAFGVYVTDEWGNVSDTLFNDIAPLYETILDKSKFFEYVLPRDNTIGYGWLLPRLWDGGTTNNDGWHTLQGGKWPIICTYGLGVNAKLSRFTMWQRAGIYSYALGNPREFSLWGTEEISPEDADLPLQSPVGTVIGHWTNLGNFTFPDPPSGLAPGSTNAEDEAFLVKGVDFTMPLNSPKTRFIRVAVSSVWSLTDFVHIMEITYYGNPQ